jgi:hypothetical protein
MNEPDSLAALVAEHGLTVEEYEEMQDVFNASADEADSAAKEDTSALQNILDCLKPYGVDGMSDLDNPRRLILIRNEQVFVDMRDRGSFDVFTDGGLLLDKVRAHDALIGTLEPLGLNSWRHDVERDWRTNFG